MHDSIRSGQNYRPLAFTSTYLATSAGLGAEMAPRPRVLRCKACFAGGAPQLRSNQINDKHTSQRIELGSLAALLASPAAVGELILLLSVREDGLVGKCCQMLPAAPRGPPRG